MSYLKPMRLCIQTIGGDDVPLLRFNAPLVNSLANLEGYIIHKLQSTQNAQWKITRCSVMRPDTFFVRGLHVLHPSDIYPRIFESFGFCGAERTVYVLATCFIQQAAVVVAAAAAAVTESTFTDKITSLTTKLAASEQEVADNLTAISSLQKRNHEITSDLAGQAKQIEEAQANYITFLEQHIASSKRRLEEVVEQAHKRSRNADVVVPAAAAAAEPAEPDSPASNYDCDHRSYD